MDYEIVIGLEVHAELSTRSKIFCSCSNEFGGEPNTHCCPICTGMPGTLPVLNRTAVEYAVKAGLAMNCTIPGFSKMDRKNYFYPDLPKAYQISQFDLPLCVNGFVEIETGGIRKKIGITRIHLEEDAGKLLHDDSETGTLIDYNRCGVPLVEIVSEPDMRSPEEARAFVESVKEILGYIAVSDCKMQEGSLRADVNLSVRQAGSTDFGTRTEMKNLNSFRSIQRAAESEAQRQITELKNGGKILQETRRWDDANGISFAMRSKEEAHDYRYFPEPDLVPAVVDEKWLENIRSSLPELPRERRDRYVKEYGLPEYDAGILTSTRQLSDFFEDAVREVKDLRSIKKSYAEAVVKERNTEGADKKRNNNISTKEYGSIKAISNWIMGDMLRIMKDKGMDIKAVPFRGSHLAKLVSLAANGNVSAGAAKKVFEDMFETGNEPELIIKEKGLESVNDIETLAAAVNKIIAANPQSVADFKNGKDKVFGFLVGQVMKELKGKADPLTINRLLREVLQ